MYRLFPLTYTRPKRVNTPSIRSDSVASSVDEKAGSIRSGGSGHSAGIPDALTFDKIVNGGTCPPMTLRDFMNYLLYIEHSAENLQFYLWYQSYVQRFNACTNTDLKLSPEWTHQMQEETVARIRKDNVEKRKTESPAAAEIFKGTDFDKTVYVHEALAKPKHPHSNPFNSPPQTPLAGDAASTHTGYTSPSTHASTYKSQAADAFANAGARLPFTVQPFREEINRIIATYIMDGSPRQLNLSGWEQKAAVQALSFTTHPSALTGLFKLVDHVLRRQAHPNFVRWSIYNGNPARTWFARGLGIFLIIGGFAIAIPITLSSLGSGYRALAAIAWALGISTLIAAYNGMCVVLHGMHSHHLRPWELFVPDEEEDEKGNMSKRSLESFSSSNSYEDEPWVVKYEKRNVVKKIFDRQRWIQEPALRQIQDTIFVQALLGAVVGAGVLSAIFVAVPGGHLF